MAAPNKVAKLNFTGVDATFQTWLNQLADVVNAHSGYSGPVQLANHLDLSGNRLMNVAAPQAPTDALTSAAAESRYSASTLKSQLQPGGTQSMPGYRMLGSSTQREPSSSFLNSLMSTVPNANAIYPTIVNVGSSVEVTIPSSPFLFSDGSSVILEGRYDVLSRPASYTITAISQTCGVVTAVFSYTGTGPSLAAGNVGTVAGVADSTYDGTFTLISVARGSGTVTVQYQQTTTNSSSSGGTFSLSGVFYYAAQKKSAAVSLLGPFSSDTASNRINACFDGFQIVAVVVITSSGGQIASSGGGGSVLTGSPASGCFF